MIKKLFFMAAVLLPTLAYGGNPNADLSVQIFPATTPAVPTVPAGAQAAGFTTLAANYDWTQPMPANWLGCFPPDGQTHQWYQGGWFVTDSVPCNTINLVQDPVYGGQVLDNRWPASGQNPTTGYAPGQGTNTIETISNNSDGNKFTDFPNAYYEITFRVQTTPDIVNSKGWANVGGSWWDGFMWPTNAVTQNQAGLELDIVEDHGDFPAWPSGGYFNWGKGGCGGNACSGTYGGTDVGAGFDPRIYHTFGLRVTSDGSTAMAVCG